jgi:hypothetical protein
MARPAKITPEHMEPYFEAVRQGMPQYRAAAFADVSEDTIQRARQHAWFSGAEKRAEAECIQRRLKTITAAGDQGNWTASAWILERRFKAEFAKEKEGSKSDDDLALITRTIKALMESKK